MLIKRAIKKQAALFLINGCLPQICHVSYNAKAMNILFAYHSKWRTSLQKSKFKYKIAVNQVVISRCWLDAILSLWNRLTDSGRHLSKNINYMVRN